MVDCHAHRIAGISQAVSKRCNSEPHFQQSLLGAHRKNFLRLGLLFVSSRHVQLLCFQLNEHYARKKVSNTQNFSKSVRQLRERMGLNQEEFASRVGISRNYVSMIETGREPSESLRQLIELMEKQLDPPTTPEVHSLYSDTVHPSARCQETPPNDRSTLITQLSELLAGAKPMAKAHLAKHIRHLLDEIERES